MTIRIHEQNKGHQLIMNPPFSLVQAESKQNPGNRWKVIILEICGVIVADFEYSRIGAMAKSIRERFESSGDSALQTGEALLEATNGRRVVPRIARSVEGAFCDDGLGSSSCHRCGLVAGVEWSYWPQDFWGC
jgi:hypothetical protein